MKIVIFLFSIIGRNMTKDKKTWQIQREHQSTTFDMVGILNSILEIEQKL